jgi:hypothetical protein
MKRADLCGHTKSTLDPQPSSERLKIMSNDNSAQPREETPHSTSSINIKRRAQSLVDDKSTSANERVLIRYALEIDDPYLPELVRRVAADEPLFDIDLS